MQRHLPKFVLAFFFLSILFVLTGSSYALTQIRSSVTIKQNSTSSSESITQSTRINVNVDGEGITVIEPKVSIQPTIVLKQTTANIINSPTPIQNKETPPVQTTPANTITPSKTSAPTTRPSITASPTVSVIRTDEKKIYILNAINNYRKSQGLSGVQASAETCAFAKIRAQEISVNFNHDGFRDRINNKSIPYSKWSLITENLAMTANYKDVVGIWIASSGHAANMRKDTPFVCVENYGNYYAYEGMRP